MNGDELNMQFDNKKGYENVPAIVFHDKRISYEEFLKKCAIFAFVLNKYHVEDKIVAVIINKSPELIICMYACFLYGFTFVPIDPSYPHDRINKILEEVDPAVIAVDRSNIEWVSNRMCILTPDVFKYLKDSDLLKLKIRSLQEIANRPNIISTLYFTSGSTGKPKGVVITREGQINHIIGLSKYIDFGLLHQTLTLTSISFDLFFDQSIMPLYYGVGLVIADEVQQKDPRCLVELLSKNKIDVLSVTPSILKLISFIDKNLSCLKNVKYIMFGGEKCSLDLLYSLQNSCNAILYNMYGPTEATVYATISNLTEAIEINVGKALPNYEIFILDNKKNKLDINEKGEIAIAGTGLAKGYYKEEELTRSCFVNLPSIGNRRVYLTGDIGLINGNGDLYCFGRIDNQIKIKGFRIEPEEIEAIINLYQGIDQSLVNTIDLSDNTKFLVAWYVGEIIDIEELTVFLKSKLADYMIPCRYYKISKFEYNANGKLNRKVEYSTENLINKTNNSILIDDSNLIFSKVVASIVDNVAEEYKNLTKDLSLVSVGIDSINYIKIIVDLEEKFGMEFEPEFLVFDDNETIEQFSFRIGCCLNKYF